MELLIYMFVDFALQLIAQKIILRREHTRIFPSHLFEYKIHCGGFFVGGFLHLIIDSYTLSYFLLSTFEYIYMYMCEYHRNTRDYINSENRRKKNTAHSFTICRLREEKNKMSVSRANLCMQIKECIWMRVHLLIVMVDCNPWPPL